MTIPITNKSRHIFCFFLILSFINSAVVAYGQDDEIEIFKEIKETRTLGGHYFTPNNILKSPFILTHVRMSIGIGNISDIKVPLIQIGNRDFLYLQGDIFAALLSFEYQHAVKDWLAVHMRFGLIGRLGSDFGTLLIQGINYATAFNIGWMIQVFRNEMFALSTTLSVTNGDYTFISIQNFVNDVINNMPNPSILISNNSLYGKLGIKAAYGLTQFIGLNVVADLGYGETIQRELQNKWFTILGLNADMNFANVFKTPLSLSVGYYYSNYPQNNNEVIFNRNVLFTQINYIGRTNFILSLDLSINKELGGENNKTLWLNTTEFSMRYLF
jgi:hypothetical protein